MAKCLSSFKYVFLYLYKQRDKLTESSTAKQINIWIRLLYTRCGGGMIRNKVD